MMSLITQRRVARALRAGSPEVIEVGVEEVAPLKPGEALVRVEAAGLNHVETLIRSGTYTVRLPFPYAVGGEGSGTVVETGSGGTLSVGTRVCWGAVLGSCATFVMAPASMLVPIPDGLSFEDGACLAVAGLTAGGLAQGSDVIGIASGKRVDAARAAGANHVIDRITQDVRDAVNAYTEDRGVAAVFDPIGASTFETSLQLLAPRGCLISYGELSGPAPAINLHQLFPGSVFVTKYNGMRWVEGFHEFAGLISNALVLATRRPAVISDIAGRFPLDHVADAYRMLESGVHGKVLVRPWPATPAANT